MLNYRLLGMTVRETTSLLEAAPRSAAPAAFATESFRRQFCNFGAGMWREDAKMLGAAMSAALPDRPQPREGVSSVWTGEMGDFGEATLWRVRGVGAMPVSVVKLVAADHSILMNLV
jgi:hypothetical protein